YRVLLDLIPKEEELEEGDVVVTSSLGGVFPDDLLVGELQYVQKSDLTAFQGGAVKPFFQIQKDNSLFILRNYP
ncbi:MAG: rod shape-determining protein MreC, partial [bacterium]|nr:rod shape-determining protein MreC [bacterium]